MHLLVEVRDNISEWREALTQSGERPRLPLPFAFGGAFLQRGHKLSAVNLAPSLTPGSSYHPFATVYSKDELAKALRDVDIATLWGRYCASAILRRSLMASQRRRVILNSYTWRMCHVPTLRTRISVLHTRLAARLARAVVVLTAGQAAAARSSLPYTVPVVRLRCGIDTAFYRVPSRFEDVPEQYRSTIENLLSEPFVIMPGDELRLNQHALEIVSNSDIRLVRISQYARSERPESLRREVHRRGIEDRFLVLEKISYPFMRFLLQHASAYAGLVDSTWQPAGWTVACEAMASGLPVVVYEGLVSEELLSLGASTPLFRSVPRNDARAFQEALQFYSWAPSLEESRQSAATFAAQTLDLARWSEEFVLQIEGLVACS